MSLCVFVWLLLAVVYGPAGTKLGRKVGVEHGTNVAFLSVCAGESQAGNPIGSALVWLKWSCLIHRNEYDTSIYETHKKVMFNTLVTIKLPLL